MTPDSSAADPVDTAVAEYLRAAGAGRPPDRAAFLARHADVAGELAEFLDDRDRLADLLGPLSTADPGSTPRPDRAPDDTVTAAGPGAPDGDTPPPEVVGGYELLGEIARGGMGVVYRARDVRLNRTVALKMVLAGRLASVADRGRFLREAEAAAALDHPHVVPIYELGEHAGTPFFSMKLVEGTDLAAHAKLLAGDSRAVARVAAAVARAVHFAHQRGILHRDLKPSNVLIDAAGEPHVTDFGLAVRLDAGSLASGPGGVAGTPAYMAPEQAAGERDRQTTATDVWGLGAILYHLLTGRAPFKAPSVPETLLRVLRDEPDAPTLVRPGVPRDLEVICLKCLAKESSKRYPSAEAMADDLDRWLRGEPIHARPATHAERAVKWVRRNPTRAALGGSVVLLVGLAAGGLVWRERAEADQVRVEGERKLVQAKADADRTLAETRARLGVEAAVGLAAELRGKYRFVEANAALDQAAALIPRDAPADLRDLRQRAADELALVIELDAIRMRRSVWVPEPGGKGNFDEPAAPAAYRAAFLARGLDVVGEDPSKVADRVRATTVRADLVTALDDWAVVERDARIRARVQGVARLADPGPWTDRFRDPAVHADPVRLAWVARAADPVALAPGTVTALAHLMERRKLDPSRLLLAAQFAHPGDFMISFALGQWFHYEAQRDQDAVAHYRAARAIRPDNFAVLNNLSSALHGVGDLDGATRCSREAVRVAPRTAHSHYNLAIFLEMGGHADAAIASYRESVRLDPGLAVAHNNLGRILLDRGDGDGALASFRDAVRADPTLPQARSNLGRELFNRGDRDGALVHTREAVRLDPTKAAHHRELGVILAKAGDPDGALRSFRDATRADPKDAAAHAFVGRVLHDKGDLPGAIAAYREAIRLGAAIPRLHASLGMALLRMGDAGGAVEAYRAAVKFDPADASSYQMLGVALATSGDLGGADRSFREAIRLNPTDAQAHYNLGNTLRDRKDVRGAIAAYREAIRLNPKYGQAFNNLGLALDEKGDPDGALAAYQHAVRADPKLPQARENLDRALKLKAKRDAKVAPPPRPVVPERAGF